MACVSKRKKKEHGPVDSDLARIIFSAGFAPSLALALLVASATPKDPLTTTKSLEGVLIEQRVSLRVLMPLCPVTLNAWKYGALVSSCLIINHPLQPQAHTASATRHRPPPAS